MNQYESFVRLILDNPGDQTCRLVFADWLEEHNDLLHKDMRFVQNLNDVEGDGYSGDGDGSCGDGGYGNSGYGDGSGYSDGDGDGGGGYGDGNDSHGDGDGGSCGFGDGSGYGDGSGGGGFGDGKYRYEKNRENIEIKDGIYILSIRSSYVPYAFIGNVEVQGFDLIVTNGKIIRRFGFNYSLEQLATDGPDSDTELLPASEKEIIFRPNVSRAIIVNKNKWENHLTLGD